MNYRLLMLCSALVSCAQAERVRPPSERMDLDLDEIVKIDPTKPPSGAEAMRALLKNQSFPLKGTGCSGGPHDRNTLHDLLAVTFGAGVDTEPGQQVIYSGDCKAEQFELRSGSTIDGWRCTLNTRWEFIKKAEYIYTSSIFFGIRKDNREFITDSITPNPLICMP